MYQPSPCAFKIGSHCRMIKLLLYCTPLEIAYNKAIRFLTLFSGHSLVLTTNGSDNYKIYFQLNQLICFRLQYRRSRGYPTWRRLLPHRRARGNRSDCRSRCACCCGTSRGRDAASRGALPTGAPKAPSRRRSRGSRRARRTARATRWYARRPRTTLQSFLPTVLSVSSGALGSPNERALIAGITNNKSEVRR